jgi:hypothetical protein
MRRKVVRNHLFKSMYFISVCVGTCSSYSVTYALPVCQLCCCSAVACNDAAAKCTDQGCFVLRLVAQQIKGKYDTA